MTDTTPRRHPNWVLLATIVASGMVFLDGTVVNVAIRRIGEELPATVLGTLEAQAYITSGFLAILAALLILGGALADKYGRRRIFLMGLAGFALTSVLCGVAPSLEFLVIARLAQGASGALLVPGSLAIITASFDGPARGRAFGIWAAATSGLLVFGPLIGGVLVDSFTWRMAFFINVPFAVLASLAAWRYVPESRDPDAPERVDWLGSLTVTVAIAGLTFGLIRGTESDWTASVAWISLGLGIAAGIAFPWLMLRREDPLVPPSLFRRRTFTVINLATFAIYGALYVSQFLVSLFVQGGLGYTAFAAALVALPSGVALALGSTVVGSIAGRIGTRPFLIVGPLLMAASQLWLARIPWDSAAWVARPGAPSTWLPPGWSTVIDVLLPNLLFGLGLMLVVAPLTTALMGSIPTANAGLGSAINNAISRVGQPLVLAVLFIVISAAFYDTLASEAPALVHDGGSDVRYEPLNRPPPSATTDAVRATTVASTEAFHLAMLATALLLGLGAAITALGLPRSDGASNEGPSGEEAVDRPT
ncbi:MAG: MFS transporter [Candidatus Limnocylindrales bacterium]